MTSFFRIATLAAIIIALAGCRGNAKATMMVSTYNYTTHSLFDVRIQSAARAFIIQSAASGGSVLRDIADKDSLPDGTEYYFMPDVCCFIMSDQVAPKKLRIVWNVVYDLAKFRRGEVPSYNERLEKRAPPGSTWCSTVIDLRGSMSKQTNKLVVHFLQDGTVIGIVGSDEVDRPLDKSEIALHSAQRQDKRFCDTEIPNPWFGSPPKKHLE
jgi:hypothetical protein